MCDKVLAWQHGYEQQLPGKQLQLQANANYSTGHNKPC
jgi:hypothetical protein